MRKNALLKDFFREIRKNRGRFFSILCIVMLGTAFYAGLRSSGTDMKLSADSYYDSTRLMDVRVISTLGLTEDDLTLLGQIDGVEKVEGGRTREALLHTEDATLVIRAIARSEGINETVALTGRAPETADECLIDESLVREEGYGIGDVIRLVSGDDEDLSETLSRTEFTIVGTGLLPYYTELTRGTGSIGDGAIDAFIVLSPEVFTSEIYTEACLTVADAADEVSFSDAYDELVAAVTDRIDGVSDMACERRYSEVRREAEETLADARQQVADGESELEEAAQKIADGEAELADAEEEIAEKTKELEDGRKEVSDGRQAIFDAQAEIDRGRAQAADGAATLNISAAELEKGRQELADGQAQYDAGLKAYEKGSADLTQAQAALAQKEAEYEAGLAVWQENAALYEEKEAQYNSGREAYEAGKAEYEAGLTAYEAALAELEQSQAAFDAQMAAFEAAGGVPEEMQAQVEAMRMQLETGWAELNASKAKLDETRAVLEETGAQLDAAQAELEAGKTQLDAVKSRLDEGKAQLEAGQAQIDAGLKEMAAAKQELDDSKTQLDAAKTQIADGETALARGRQALDDSIRQLDDAQAQVDRSRRELEDAEAALRDGESQLADGRQELKDARQELSDAKTEYEDALPEARQEIEDAKKKIADGETALAELKMPEWYILDRGMMESVFSYDQNADRMDNLSKVFPVIFFLVAALVSLTAMTRMVDEQRLQIGTMKALGFPGRTIAGRYIGYAILATAAGSVVGVAFGEWFLPRLIIQSYGTLYVGMPLVLTPVNWPQAIQALGYACAATGIATLGACLGQLRTNPAELMRTKGPEKGQRVLLERISFIWKHLSFNRKSTVRNLVRYKKRLIMTVIGVGGCMGLLLVGFGLHDSINEIAKHQYIQIFMQDASVTVDTGASESRRSELENFILEADGVARAEEIMLSSVDLNFNGRVRNAYLYVPKSPELIGDYLTLRDRVSREPFEFPEEGAYISEKTATMLGLKVGDTVSLTSDNGPTARVQVTKIVENYVLHYLFISPQTYREIYGEEAEYNSIYIKYTEEGMTEAAQSDFGAGLMKMKGCTGVSFATDLQKSIDDMLAILGAVVAVLIAAAGLLAFVVLYNLNSINIMERRRELATLKVLGFYDEEVAMYVYRENIILTILGVCFGLIFGTILHRFVVVTVEVDLMMFGRMISPFSYVVSVLITFAFSLIVNGAMFYILRKVDMVESLKSVE